MLMSVIQSNRSRVNINVELFAYHNVSRLSLLMVALSTVNHATM